MPGPQPRGERAGARCHEGGRAGGGSGGHHFRPWLKREFAVHGAHLDGLASELSAGRCLALPGPPGQAIAGRLSLPDSVLDGPRAPLGVSKARAHRRRTTSTTPTIPNVSWGMQK